MPHDGLCPLHTFHATVTNTKNGNSGAPLVVPITIISSLLSICKPHTSFIMGQCIPNPAVIVISRLHYTFCSFSQDMNSLVGLYNDVVEHMVSVVQSSTPLKFSWPLTEIAQTLEHFDGKGITLLYILIDLLLLPLEHFLVI